MSRRVLFNGAILVRPGAATKIDASQFQNISLNGLGIVGLIGEAESGEPRTVQVFTSPAAVKTFYRSGDLVEAAQIAADPGNDPRIATGAQALVCYKVNNSTQASYAHAATLTYTTRRYGIAANSVTVTVSVPSGSLRVVTITDLDDQGLEVTEVSPSLGGTGKFSIQYVGADPGAVTMTITATQLTTATSATPGENLTLLFTDYPTLTALVTAINNHVAYTCTALVTNALVFDTTYLDLAAAVDIKTAPYTNYARNWDIFDWINNNSQIITATLVKAQAAPVAALARTTLAGGTRGTSASSDWTTGLTALGAVRINQLVPLASENATTAQGTFTIAAITAALVAHCKFYSSTAGRSERQGWVGVNMTKTNLIAEANTHNSEHLCLVGQKTKRLRTSDSSIVFFAEWAMAVTLAGLRAGAPLGEPITWKFINSSGISSDSSWSEGNNDDVTDLTLNGVIVVNNIRGKGYRIDKAITTFTKMDNDAFTEETIVQIWKNVAYELRTTLEDTYTGRPGNLKTVYAVPGTVSAVLELFREAGAITDSIIDGVTIKAYRNITVSLSGDQLSVGVTISPTPGINFILNTIVLVPAQISL